jgi:phenylpyruvate C(3)-methyltransferase
MTAVLSQNASAGVPLTSPPPAPASPASSPLERRSEGAATQLKQLVWAAQVLGVGHLNRLRQVQKAGLAVIARGHWLTRVGSTLFNIGFFDDMERAGAIDVDSYAAVRGLDPAVLRPLCDYLFALKILDKENGRFTLSGRGRFVTKSLRGMFESAYAYEDVLHNLEPLVRGQKRYGVDVDRNPEFTARGSGEGGRLFTFPLVSDLIAKRGLKTVLDLACGDAPFLIDLCRRNPEVRAYGVDLAPEAIDFGNERVREAGLQDRIRLVAGDMFEIGRVADQFESVDVVTSFYGFQELLAEGREKVIGLLDTYRRVFPGVTFIICEIPKYAPEELRRRPGGMLEYQLWHALTHQRLATREEWMDLWRESGIREVEEHYLGFARTVFYVLR